VKAVAEREGFRILLLPGSEPGDPLLGAIANSRSLAALLATVEDQPLDYRPPSDERPYFFNLVRPDRVLAGIGEWSTGTIAIGQPPRDGGAARALRNHARPRVRDDLRSARAARTARVGTLGVPDRRRVLRLSSAPGT
jgi:hypothetical protein